MTHADDSTVSDIGGFTYDTTRYKVVYTVTEDNNKKGGLACSGPAITKQTWNAEKEQYEDADTAVKTGLDFVNDYDETKIPPEVSITKDGAATSYKDGTASWTVTLKVENLKQGQKIENFIFTDEMTTFKPAGIGAETTIQEVQVAATTGKLVSYDEPDVKGNKVTINFGTLQYSDTVDGTLVYTITYTTKTALTLNGAAVDMEKRWKATACTSKTALTSTMNLMVRRKTTKSKTTSALKTWSKRTRRSTVQTGLL